MHFSTRDGYTIIKRHYIILFFRLAKFIFLFLFVVAIYWLSMKYTVRFEDIEYINIISFLFVFALINYAFFSLVLSIINYYFNIIVIYKDQIVFIKCTLLFQDDVEIFDAYRIVKVDGFARGILANVLGYGNLVIEQQKNDVRTFHFIPKPYKILMIINKQRETVLAERKKKYIMTDDEKHDMNEKHDLINNDDI